MVADASGQEAEPGSLRQRVAVVIRARLLTTLVDTLTGILLVRLLSKGDFAVLLLLLLVHETLKQIATLGLPESVLYFAEHWGPTRRRALAQRTLLLVSANAVGSALIMLALSATTDLWLSSWAPGPRGLVARYLPWMALMALGELPTWPTTNILLGVGKPAHAGRYEVVTSALLLASIVLPAALGLGLAGVAFGLLAYGGTRLLLSLAWLVRVLPRVDQERLAPGALREQLHFAFPLGLSTLTARINKYIDRTVVAVLLPAAAFAEYTVATTEIPFVNAFPYGAAGVLMARYVSLFQAGDRAGLIALWYRAARAIGLLVVPVGVLLIGAAPDLIELAFGRAYLPAAVPFQIFCGILLLRVANFGALVQAFGRTRAVLRVTLTVFATNLVLNIPLTLSFGVVGTASATLFANLVGAVLTFRVIGLNLHLHWWQALPVRAYLTTVATACTASALALCVRHLVLPDGLHVAVRLATSITVGLASYLLLGALTGLLQRDDLGLLRALIKPSNVGSRPSA